MDRAHLDRLPFNLAPISPLLSSLRPSRLLFSIFFSLQVLEGLVKLGLACTENEKNCRPPLLDVSLALADLLSDDGGPSHYYARPDLLRPSESASKHDPPAPRLCVVCEERPRDTVFLPCSHATCCRTCALLLSGQGNGAGPVVGSGPAPASLSAAGPLPTSPPPQNSNLPTPPMPSQPSGHSVPASVESPPRASSLPLLTCPACQCPVTSMKPSLSPVAVTYQGRPGPIEASLALSFKPSAAVLTAGNAWSTLEEGGGGGDGVSGGVAGGAATPGQEERAQPGGPSGPGNPGFASEYSMGQASAAAADPDHEVRRPGALKFPSHHAGVKVEYSRAT